jgi:MoaA/NifB/PqqE/SkfB family radical SAM enzyme
MSMELFRKIIDEAGRYLYRIQLYDFGEPFTNKHLLDMIALAADHGIGCQVSSNFSFNFSNDYYRRIVESGLEHLIVALDGINQQVYSQYRVNGNYEFVEAGLRAVIDWKRRLGRKSPFIEWQFIVFDHNRHQIEAVKEQARKIGVDRLCLKYDARADSNAWDRRDRIKLKTSRLFRLNSCLWLWGALLVNSDGQVSPCCNAAHDDRIGDLNTTSIRSLWNSTEIKTLRASVRRGSCEERSGAQVPCVGCGQIL